MEYDVLIIGAGASGMVAAIEAARRNLKVMIIEKSSKAGRKINATGNGKCNYTNSNMDKSKFRGQDFEFVTSALLRFGYQDTLNYFKKLGIFPKNKNGYVYPYSEQAQAVSTKLIMELEKEKVTIIYDDEVQNIKNISSGKFYIYTLSKQYLAKNVIVASGGKASKKLGTDGRLIEVIEKMGHKIVPTVPALVALKTSDKGYKEISGVRIQAKAKLFINGSNDYNEAGEVIFTDYGISGIPIMQLSRYAAYALFEKKKVHIELDLFYELTKEELIKELSDRKKIHPEWDDYNILIGLVNNKFAAYIDKKYGKSDIRELADILKNFIINISDTNGWDNAQTMAGGIDTKQINEHMESTIIKGLYFTGEIMDVDGTCGGYNLQWAWTTGYIAGNNVK